MLGSFYKLILTTVPSWLGHQTYHTHWLSFWAMSRLVTVATQSWNQPLLLVVR